MNDWTILEDKFYLDFISHTPIDSVMLCPKTMLNVVLRYFCAEIFVTLESFRAIISDSPAEILPGYG